MAYRRPSREISIFNLSMLDVICSALGAFVILFIIAQQKAEECDQPCSVRCPCDESCPVTCDESCPCEQTCPITCAEDCPCDDHCPVTCEQDCPCDEVCPVICEQDCPCDDTCCNADECCNNDKCPCDTYCPCECPDPPPPFVAVLIRWPTTNVDIDLFVTNPQGKTCYYGDYTACGGEVIKDYLNAGVTEIFIGRQIPLEDRWWTVEYWYYLGSSSADVAGFVYYAEGMYEIPVRTFRSSEARKRIKMLQFKVDGQGKLHFRLP